MAQHRALPARNLQRTIPTATAPRTTHRMRTALLWVGGFFLVMYVIGHNAQQAAQQAAQPTAVAISTDGTDGYTTPAQVRTLPRTTATVIVTPPAVTVTSTASPATVATTEYPADVTTTEYPDHATVTETAAQQTITLVVRPDPATATVDATTLPHCAEEDGSGRTESCVWDSSVDGNGQGTAVLTYVGADQ